MGKLIDLTGQVFGRLTVISEAGRNKWGNKNWQCLCVCGLTRIASQNHLVTGTVESCGCLAKELLINRLTIHGKTNTREFRIWTQLKTRCYFKAGNNYHRYGGRGIKVCDRWMDSFENFINDMGECPTKKHSLDRKNNDGDYTPNNCRWATSKQQCNNRSNSLIVEYRGERGTLTEICAKFNANYMTVWDRVYKANWNLVDAMEKPVRILQRNPLNT